MKRSIGLYIPAYNAAATLPVCLRAVTRQTRKPDDIVVVDDGSTDDTPKIARSFGVRVVRHARNRGVGAARNTGVHATSGELVASLDADIAPPRDWLARITANFRHGRPIAGCCGRVVEKYADTIADRWRGVHMPLHFGRRRSYAPRWMHGGQVFVRDVLEGVGAYDERCRSAYEDVEVCDRIREAGGVLLYDPEVVSVHHKRSRPQNIIRGFWGYWAAKNQIEGAYRSLAGATELLQRRQMGIAEHRLGCDLKQRRDELTPLDLLIPLTFCARDLDEMARLRTLKRRSATQLQRALVTDCVELCDGLMTEWAARAWASLAFGGAAPLDETAGRAALSRTERRYLNVFRQSFESLLQGVRPADQQRITAAVPAVLREAVGA